MAVNFSLTRKGETVPCKLQDADADFCAILGVPVHDTDWVAGWYDVIGLMIACGRDLTYIREAVKGYYYETSLLKICDYLEQAYETDCWGSR